MACSLGDMTVGNKTFDSTQRVRELNLFRDNKRLAYNSTEKKIVTLNIHVSLPEVQLLTWERTPFTRKGWEEILNCFCTTSDLLIFIQLETSTLLKVHCVTHSPSDTAKAWGTYFIL